MDVLPFLLQMPSLIIETLMSIHTPSSREKLSTLKELSHSSIATPHQNSENLLRRDELYPKAYALPPFFLQNLQSEDRIIKEFRGEDSIIRAFYYQLMKLACEIEIEGKDYMEEMKDMLIGENLFCLGELTDKYYTDEQYRSYLTEFLKAVEEQEVPSFEKTAKAYPMIDEILLLYFKKIVPVSLLVKEHESSEESDF